MKRTFSIIIAFAIALLFFIQAAGALVESIYVPDLMHTYLDAKVLGLLFFFAPLLLLPFFKKFSFPLAWIFFDVLVLSRSLLPWLNTADSLLASGFASAAALSLFFLLLEVQPGLPVAVRFSHRPPRPLGRNLLGKSVGRAAIRFSCN
jgi:hypothetical protein